MKTRYIATSTIDLAFELDRIARLAEDKMRRTKHEKAIDAAYIKGLRHAADIVRITDIQPEDNT